MIPCNLNAVRALKAVSSPSQVRACLRLVFSISPTFVSRSLLSIFTGSRSFEFNAAVSHPTSTNGYRFSISRYIQAVLFKAARGVQISREELCGLIFDDDIHKVRYRSPPPARTGPLRHRRQNGRRWERPNQRLMWKPRRRLHPRIRRGTDSATTARYVAQHRYTVSSLSSRNREIRASRYCRWSCLLGCARYFHHISRFAVHSSYSCRHCAFTTCSA